MSFHPKITPTYTMEEAEEAMSISLKSFYPAGHDTDTLKIWRHKWFSDPSFNLGMLYVVRNDQNIIIGGLKTISRILKRGEQQLRMFGIGEIFIEPSYQGKGITTPLVQYVISEGQKQGYDIMTCVARKRIDYFYLKFGLFGLSSYNEIILKGFRENYELHEKLSLVQFKPDYMNRIKQLYDQAYSNTFGVIQREDHHWKFILEKFDYLHCTMHILFKENNLVGYFIKNEDKIIEIAIDPQINLVDAINFIWKYYFLPKKQNEIILQIAHTHSLLQEDLKLDVTLKTRECYYGGHIVKILNINNMITLYKQRTEKFLRQKSICNFFHQIGNLRVTWDGREMIVSFPEGIELSYQETSFLLGISTVYNQQDDWMFPRRLPFNLLELDTF
ncbi:GNAT family N-acetyltransferase [Deltaproteobacteria bacterium TL4]